MAIGPQFGAAEPPGGTRAQLRVSAQDRDRAIEFLQTAFGDGRLSKEEYDARSERALAAVTFRDLDVLVTDLPGTGGFSAPTLAPTRTNSLAIASLLCGIGQLLLWIFAGVPAIVCGHIARRQIRETGEQGAGMALAGLILGYAGLALAVLFVVLFAVLFIAFAAGSAHSGG